MSSFNKASSLPERVKRIIACGPIRSGKTFGFCTIPGRKLAWVFDPNAADTLRSYSPNTDVATFFPDTTNINAGTLAAGRRDTDVSVREPKAYPEFAEEFDRFVGDPSYPNYINNYDAVLFDGMTAFQQIVMDRVQHLSGRFGKWPEQADWTASMNTITSVFRRLVAQNVLLYLTVHTDYKDVKLIGPTEQLNMIGQLRNTIPGLFTDLWHFTAALDEKNRPTFQVQTRADDTKRILGTSMPKLGVFENVTVDFAKPIEGQGIGALLTKGGFYAD